MTDGGELARDLRGSVMRLARRLRQMHHEPLGLTQNQLAVLGDLMREGSIGLKRLAEIEQVQPPAITRTVNSLVELGLVLREPDPEDGRRAEVRLTERAREVVLADRDHRDRWLRERLDTLTEEERRVLAQAVEILRKVGQG